MGLARPRPYAGGMSSACSWSWIVAGSGSAMMLSSAVPATAVLGVAGSLLPIGGADAARWSWASAQLLLVVSEPVTGSSGTCCCCCCCCCVPVPLLEGMLCAVVAIGAAHTVAVGLHGTAICAVLLLPVVDVMPPPVLLLPALLLGGARLLAASASKCSQELRTPE